MLVRGKYALVNTSLGEEGIKEDWAVCIDRDKIVETGAYDVLKQKHPDHKTIGDGTQLLMPGLIDAHTHGAGLSFVQRGVTFDFLENSLLDFETALDLEPETNSILNAVRHIQNGCTTIHHNNWSMPSDPNEIENCEKKIKAYESTGIRLGFSLGIRNKNILAYDDVNFFKTLPPDLQTETEYLINIDTEAAVRDYFDAFEYLYNNYHKGKVRILLGPNWVQGSTDSFLEKVKARADELGGLPIHIHCLQTPVQKAFGLRTYGKSLVGHLDDLGLVDHNLVLGHAVYLNQLDIDLLASMKASVTHHPSCNLATRNGIAPVYAMVKAGLNVALGIDEKGINDDEDPIMEMRMIYYLHRQAGIDLTNCPALTPFDVLKIATINGAKPTGYEGQVGVLEPGMQADVILVDMDEILNRPWVSPNCSIATLFVHRGLGRHVNTVIIGGTLVMDQRKILTVDTEALYKEVKEQANRGMTPDQIHYRDLLYRIKPYYQKWYNSWLKDLEFTPFYNMNSRY
ncbi:MAG: amidohydrolase family protein [Firmicutes bacterium]|nr:amidohydrolase family protein [Bacillota bacterium]